MTAAIRSQARHQVVLRGAGQDLGIDLPVDVLHHASVPTGETGGIAVTPTLAPVSSDAIELRFRDPVPGRRLRGVRLWQELGLPAQHVQFAHDDGGWSLRLPPPDVRRMEYLLELQHPDGGSELVRDPSNPRRAGGAYGEKSVLEFPGYAAPWWLDARPVPARTHPLRAGGVDVTVWAPADAADTEPLPLLAAHDGPELDRYAALSRYCGALIAAGMLPAHRLALLAPSDAGCSRDERYAANEHYADALAGQVLPAVRNRFAVQGPVVLAGVSLGALAALHTQWRHPGTVGALFCQSGSFFTPRLDPQERGYAWFERITAFTAEVAAAAAGARPDPGGTDLRAGRGKRRQQPGDGGQAGGAGLALDTGRV